MQVLHEILSLQNILVCEINTEIYKLQSPAEDLAAYPGLRETSEMESFLRLLFDDS